MPGYLHLLAQTSDLPSPKAILGLCVLGAAGIGLLLPSDRAVTLRRLGGAILTVAGLILMLIFARKAEISGWAGETGVYFWIFSAIAIGAAVRVITHPRPVYSALYFVLTVFASAGLFVLLAAEFMAAVLVLIYAGAVLVTYVFVIMLAAENEGQSGGGKIAEVDRVARDPFLAGAIGFTLLGVLLLVLFDKTSNINLPVNTTGYVIDSSRSGAFSKAPEVQGDTQRLGQYLYQQQIVPVQLAMLILTLAMTGAVIISRRKIFIPKHLGIVEMVSGPAAPQEDNPHSIPVYGTADPKAKEYPQT